MTLEVDPGFETVVKAAARDDRVLPGTRLLRAVIVPFLLVAFALLYFFPDDTRHWFAWDVQPTITPLMMGAGYIAGAYFFVRVARETRWHRIQVGFLPVTAFTLFMAIGTFNHLDRFATAHVAFSLPGVTALMMGLDGRWTAIRITLESQLIGLALLLLGTIRAWEDIDSTNTLAYVFVAGIAGLFISLLALESYMLGREREAAGRVPVTASIGLSPPRDCELR